MNYDVTINKEADVPTFIDQCNKIKNLGYDGIKQVIDVDGSYINYYNKGDKSIEVYLDYEIGATYVKSNIDLTDIII